MKERGSWQQLTVALHSDLWRLMGNAKKATFARRNTTMGSHKDASHESPLFPRIRFPFFSVAAPYTQDFPFSSCGFLHPGFSFFQLRFPTPRIFPFSSCGPYTQDFSAFPCF
jgi:hypothetical protein